MIIVIIILFVGANIISLVESVSIKKQNSTDSGTSCIGYDSREIMLYYAQDPSGLPIIFEECTGPFVVSNPGRHVIHYYSIDKAGNIKDPPKITEFEIIDDAIPLETVCELQGYQLK